MSGPKAHVMIATPTYSGDVNSEYASCLAMATAHCILRQVWIEPRFAAGFSLVEYARNWLVAEFLAGKYTHLFWIDSDLYFDPSKVLKLVNRNVDVVCGVYTTKSDEKQFYPYTALGPEMDGLQEAERVPGGFMCMTRAAIEKVTSQCEWHEIDHNGETRLSPRMFDLVLDNKKLYGEDYIACARLRKAGYPIYVETDVSFKHWGRKAWSGNLSMTLQTERAAGHEGQSHPSAWEKNKTEKLTDVVDEPAADRAGVPKG